MHQKKSIYFFTLLATILLIQGCTTKDYVHTYMTQYYCTKKKEKICTPYKLIKSYKLNKKYSTYIGEPIIKVMKVGYECVYSITSCNTIPFIAIKNFKSIQKGKVYVPAYIIEGTKYLLTYEVCPHNNITTSFLIKVNDDGDLLSKDIFSIAENCKIANYFTENNKIFERAKTQTLKEKYSCDKNKICGIENAFHYELIYNGRMGNNIKLLYREYIGKLIRSPFFQNLIYNIKDGNIIRFRNIKIKIESATNEKLDYVILED